MLKVRQEDNVETRRKEGRTVTCEEEITNTSRRRLRHKERRREEKC
jgi:hypothetical protein